LVVNVHYRPQWLFRYPDEKVKKHKLMEREEQTIMALRKEDFNEAEASIILEEEHPVTPDYLEQILRVRERIMRESKGQLFEDSAEMVRQMREERTKYLEELREQ
jgi:hypothetical protein